LSCVAAGNIGEIERLRDRKQGLVQDQAYSPVRERVVVHHFLIGGPLLLELLERLLVVNRRPGRDVVNVDTHGSQNFLRSDNRRSSSASRLYKG